MRIGFIGLGQMGRGMAARLIERGFDLTVWNRSRAAAEPFGARGARVAERAAQALDAEVVITMLAHDAAVEAVWLDTGLVRQAPAGTVHLNMASVSLGMGRRLAALHQEAGVPYVAAPVFGRPGAALCGQLDIIAAGDEGALDRCVPVLEALGRRWFDAGVEPHRANIVKIARNYLLGAIIESLGEAFALVGKSGVDPAQFLDIITSTSMNAPAYKIYGKFILEPPDQPTFTLELGLKDVELALQAGHDSGVRLPLASLLRAQHVAAIERGYGDKDWAALANYILEEAGVTETGLRRGP